jgi:hypothetical protein
MCNESIAPGTDDNDWVPQAYTLPAMERPLRVAEFDRLFVDARRDVDRSESTRLQLRLERSAEPRARELTAREPIAARSSPSPSPPQPTSTSQST